MSDSQETIDLLKTLPGGAELAAFLGDDIEFGDGEVVSLLLDRKHGSELVISLPWKKCLVPMSRARLASRQQSARRPL